MGLARKNRLRNWFERERKKGIFDSRLLEQTMRLSEDSVDAQIDSVLLNYQNEASVEDEIEEGMPDHFKKILGEDNNEDMSFGDEELQATEPVDPKEQKINVDHFAQNIAQLYNNYENLLNVGTVIINRAINLLERGYPSDVVQEFVDVLDREFGLTPEGDKEEELPLPPAGGSAGPIS